MRIISPTEALLNRARLKREYILKEELNEEEKNILLEYWKSDNMAEFNNWVQLVNCVIHYDITQIDVTNNDINTQILKSQLYNISDNKYDKNIHIYQCKITLNF